jgi:dihydroorotate dehydrogenase
MVSCYHVMKWPLFLLSAEIAHDLVLKALQWGMILPARHVPDPILASTLWGIDFINPVGLAAGFDKNAEVIMPLAAQGFGFIEVGTVTPKAQSGNPRPRLFRLMCDKAVINRMGFNNKGGELFAEQLKKRPPHVVVGANIGKNKTTEDAAQDYVWMLEKIYGLSDYIAVNVSSPNTPGLRTLQQGDILQDLVQKLAIAKQSLRQQHHKNIPLLLKISPDNTSEQYQDIASVVLGGQVDGLIVSNTSVQRPNNLVSRFRQEAGGLSGKPLLEPSTHALKEMYRYTKGKVPIIGVGGIASGLDAYTKIRAGASLVQLYSALVYEGFGLVPRIQQELAGLLRRDGFKNIKEAIGIDVK